MGHPRSGKSQFEDLEGERVRESGNRMPRFTPGGASPAPTLTLRLILRGGVRSYDCGLGTVGFGCGTGFVFFVFEGGADEGCE